MSTYSNHDNDVEKIALVSTDQSEIDRRFDSLEDEDTSALLPTSALSQSTPSYFSHLPGSSSGTWRRKYIIVAVVSFVLVALVAVAGALYHELIVVPRRLAKETTRKAEETTRKLWLGRAEQVKDAYAHAYDDYRRLAYPHDELLPVSEGHSDKFNGWGVTLVDSLDTMLIMGLDDRFEAAMDHVKNMHPRDYDRPVPFFETIIRYLGGLLSAYHYSLSHRSTNTSSPILVKQAEAVAAALLPAFNSTSGLPSSSVVPATHVRHQGWSGAGMSLAEVGSCQLEYKYLAHLTGNAEYFRVVETITDRLVESQDNFTLIWPPMLVPTADGEGIRGSDDQFTAGASSDSAFEYFLKQYLLTGQTETRFLELYLTSMRGIIQHLLYISPRRDLLYATDIEVDRVRLDPSGQPRVHPDTSLQHLTCFLPGLLALGAHKINRTPNITRLFPDEERQLHLGIAEGLATTCWLNYADMSSGIGPDMVRFEKEKGGSQRRWWDVYREWRRDIAEGRNRTDIAPGLQVNVTIEKNPDKRDYYPTPATWYGRPETLESLFVLYRTTGNPMWRERGYSMFQAIEQWSRGPVGYASVAGVDNPLPPRFDVNATDSGPFSTATDRHGDSGTASGPYRKDDMPSFFLAETLKYLYLLFHPDSEDMVSLDRHVFNTEAHPLPMYEWSEREVRAFGVGKGPQVSVPLVPLVL